METLGIKRLSYGAIFVLAVVLVLLIAGAMFFADKVDDYFDGHGKTETTQVMELQGSWLGMKLSSLDTPTAQRLGIPASAKGVMITEIEERIGWRVRQAGAMEGDVIVAVEGQTVRNLADVYEVSRNVNVAGVVLLDIRRWGQLMTLALPALQAPPPVAPQWQPGQVGQIPPATIPGANPATGQPVAWPLQGAPGAQFCPPGARFCCPIHNRTWSQNEVSPQYRCPLCNCPLNRVQ